MTVYELIRCLTNYKGDSEITVQIKKGNAYSIERVSHRDNGHYCHAKHPVIIGVEPADPLKKGGT